jgi:predicted ATPase
MIHKIEVENFMSLKKATIDFEPLTIFIGANGSGKSAIFKALVLLSRLLNGIPVRGPKGEFSESGVTLDDLVWKGNAGLPIVFRVWLNKDQADPDYDLVLMKRAEGWSVASERIRRDDGGWIEVDEDTSFEHPTERREGTIRHTPPLRATLRYLVNPYVNDAAAQSAIAPILKLASQFGHAHRHRPSAIDIAQFVQRPTERGRIVNVAENGFGLATKLQDLQNSPTDRATFQSIEEDLRRLFPHIINIGFENDYLGVRLNYRTNRSDDQIRAPQESDGVLLATFLLWRLRTASSEMTICLEEPENGLHPVLLAERFLLLRTIATEGRQVLASTHSPEFLRALKRHPSTIYKQIRLVEFSKEAGTTVSSLAGMGEAKKLLERYWDEMHDVWEPVVKEWCK